MLTASNRGGIKLFFQNRMYSCNNKFLLENTLITRHYFVCDACKQGRASCDSTAVEGVYENFKDLGIY